MKLILGYYSKRRNFKGRLIRCKEKCFIIRVVRWKFQPTFTRFFFKREQFEFEFPVLLLVHKKKVYVCKVCVGVWGWSVCGCMCVWEKSGSFQGWPILLVNFSCVNVHPVPELLMSPGQVVKKKCER